MDKETSLPPAESFLQLQSTSLYAESGEQREEREDGTTPVGRNSYLPCFKS